MQMSQPGVMTACMMCLCVAAFLSGLVVGTSTAGEGKYNPTAVPLPPPRNTMQTNADVNQTLLGDAAPYNRNTIISEMFSQAAGKRSMSPAGPQAPAAWNIESVSLPDPFAPNLQQDFVTPLMNDDNALPSPIVVPSLNTTSSVLGDH